MGTTIDERVVEMKFDNQNFERNVQTSLNTIEKLKSSLNFTNAVKGFEDINSKIQKCDVEPVSKGVEVLKIKFSAMEVVAITALQNITNSAIAAGKRITSALTIDPIHSGFQEYETQINAVQTILANTSRNGKTILDVNKALDELNLYADKTIYNFTEMTRNIGTFTAAGVDLDTSVAAIKGIANLAAVSGSTSQQASTAMYQLSQALASGTVKLQDWNSVVNAGMGGQVFQDSLKETARVHGVAIDDMIAEEGSFRETLKDGWLTSAILTETLSKFTGDLNETQLQAMGYTDEQIAGIMQLGQTANDAATKVKTFTQLFDTLKEAAQSGWSQTWKLIVGDFEEAKERLTKISDVMGGVIGNISDRRNQMVEQAFSSKWDILSRKINEAGLSTDDFQAKIKELASSYSVDLDAMIEKEGSFHAALVKAFKDKSLDKSIITDALAAMTDGLDETTASTKNQADAIKDLKDGVAGTSKEYDELLKGFNKPSGADLVWDSFLNIINSVVGALGAVKKAWDDVFHPGMSQDDIIKQRAELIYKVIEILHSFTEHLEITDKAAKNITNTFKGFFAFIDIFKTFFSGTFYLAFRTLSTILGGVDIDILSITGNLGSLISKIHDFIFKNKAVVATTKVITGLFDYAATAISNLIDKAKNLPKIKFDLKIIGESFDNTKNKIHDTFSKIGPLVDKFIDKIHSMDKINFKSLGQVLSELQQSVVLYFMSINTSFNAFITALLNLKHDTGAAIKSISEHIGGFLDLVGEWFTKIFDYLNDTISVGQVLAILFGFGLLEAIKKISTAIDGFTNTLKRLFDFFNHITYNINALVGGIGKVLDATAKRAKSEAILNIAISIGILAAALAALTFVDQKNLWSAVGAIAAMSAVLGGLSFALSKIGSIESSISSTSFLAIASSLLILVRVMKKMEKLDGDLILRNLAVMGALVTGLVVAMGAIQMLTRFSLGNPGKVMLDMSISLILIAHSLKTLEELDPESIWRCVDVMTTLMVALSVTAGLFSFITSIGNLYGLSYARSSFALIGMALSLAIMAKTLGSIADIDGIAIAKSVTVMMLAMGALVKMAKSAEKIKFGSGVAILAMVLSLRLLVNTLKKIAKLDGAMLLRNILKFVLVFGAIEALMYATRLAGKHAKKAGIGILAISVSLTLIAMGLKKLSGISAGDIAKGTIAIGGLMGMFVMLTHMSKYAGEHSVEAGKMLFKASLAMFVLVGAVAILGKMNTKDLYKAVGAVTILGAMFAGLVYVSQYSKSCMKDIKTMATVIGILAIALGVLSLIPKERLFAASESITLMTMAFASLIAATSLDVKVGSSIFKMVGVVLVLAGVIAIMSYLKPKEVIPIALSLSTLLLAFTASLVILNQVGEIGKSSLVSIAVLSAITVGLGLLLAGLCQFKNIDKAIGVSTSLSVLILGLSAACILLEVAGLASGAALAGIAALAVLIGAFTGIIVAFGATAKLLDKVGVDLESLLDTGIPLLNKVAKGIGEFAGNIVSGFADSAMDVIPSFGTKLSEFMDNIKPFLDGIGAVDESKVECAKSLSEMILMMTGASLLDGITNLLTLGSGGFLALGEQLVPFGKQISDFSDSIKDVDAKAVQGTAEACTALAKMAQEVPRIGGLIDLFAGNKDLGTFGSQLRSFGKSLSRFSTSVADVNADNVQNAAIAGTAVAEMAQKVNNKSGLVAWLSGENNDMSKLAGQLIPFGKALVAFSTIGSSVNIDSINNAAKAGTDVAAMADSIHNKEGFLSWLSGENNSMSKFANELIPFGKALAKYSLYVSDVDAEKVSSSALASEALFKMAGKLTDVGELTDQFGRGQLSTFAHQLKIFGEAFGAYGTSIDGVDTETVKASADAAKALTQLYNHLPKSDEMGDYTSLKDFGKDLKTLGEKLLSYYESISDIDVSTLDSVINEVVKLIRLAKSMELINGDAVSGFGSALGRLAKLGIEEFVSAFNNSSTRAQAAATILITNFTVALNANSVKVIQATSKMTTEGLKGITKHYFRYTTAGKELVSRVSTGVSGSSYLVSGKFASILTSCISTIESYYSSFYQAGAYMVEGFANGISDNDYKARARASAMASKAAEAAAEALDEHSPSKVTYGIGDFFAVGFINAIIARTKQASSVASKFAESAKAGLQKNIDKIQNALDSNLDINPIIRPVLDLSDVVAKSRTLNAITSRNAAMSINTSMSGGIKDSDVAVSSLGTNVTMTQNIYSPKALSRTEIYRQTRNQLSTLKRELNK